MNKEYSLEENVQHGTKERPLTIMNFCTGKGTSYPDHFFVERHWHYNTEILKIRKGRYKAEINLETLYLQEGDICKMCIRDRILGVSCVEQKVNIPQRRTGGFAIRHWVRSFAHGNALIFSLARKSITIKYSG